ncbi:MAG: hypothetical protein WB441_05695 [Nocardioidaceae bacterium]
MQQSQQLSTRSKSTAAVAAGIMAVAGLAAIPASPSAAVGSSATVWTHVPSACSPDEASFGRYNSHVASFKHARRARGQIVTRCNVVNLPEFGRGRIPVLEVLYRDRDGRWTREGVRVDLVQARPNGSTTIVARFNSNNYPGRAYTQRRRVAFNHAFDFNRNAYYVDVRVTRSSTSAAPEASTVRLTRIR